MNPTLRTAALCLAFLACNKDAKDAPPPTATATTPPAATPAPAPAPAATAPPAPDIQLCSLLAAADIGAIFGKTVVATGTGHSCEYALDPTEKQKAMAGMSPEAMAKAAASGGGIKIPSAIADQLVVNVSVERDEQTEDQVKAIYAGVGKTVNASTHPEQHGATGVIEVSKDVPGVGDWAFSTNVAAVNMGMGMSTRGRLLEARKGPSRITVGATIAPDPGEAKLDAQLADVTRAVIAKLP
jgi:hypothetical protein